MIRATTNGDFMSISGLNPEIPRSTVTEWLEDVAEQVDERIAKDWERERAAGRKMPANTEETDQRKATDGLELKVGTATGNLQDHLDSGGYWTVGAVSAGKATIRWNEDALIGDVEYAEYVAELKVTGARILTVLQKDCRMAERYLADREADWARAHDSRPAATASRRQVQTARGRLGSTVRVV